jgi:hypothetical protein
MAMAVMWWGDSNSGVRLGFCLESSSIQDEEHLLNKLTGTQHVPEDHYCGP